MQLTGARLALLHEPELIAITSPPFGLPSFSNGFEDRHMRTWYVALAKQETTQLALQFQIGLYQSTSCAHMAPDRPCQKPGACAQTAAGGCRPAMRKGATR